MKSTKFSFFLIFFLISFLGINELKAQHFKCGTPPPTEAERAEIIRRLRLNDASRSTGCTDPINNSAKTYKLILEYSVKGGTHFLSPSDKTNIENHLNSTFASVNVSFQISYFPVMCDDCDDHRSAGWGRVTPLDNQIDFKDCLWGRITLNTVDGRGGYGNNTGRFASQKNNQSIAHELGHALGLLHTFASFSATNPSLNENVVQDDRAGCPCNCKVTGDYICDTQSDPFIDQNDAWKNQMFNYSPRFSGLLNTSSPTMNKVQSFNSGSCQLSTTGTNVYYEASPFTVSTSGNYTFETPDFNTLHLYQNSFNSLSPCTNLIGLHSFLNFTPDVTFNLTAGVNYILVISENINGKSGSYSSKILNSAGQIISSNPTLQVGIVNIDNIQDNCGIIYSNSNLNEDQIMNNVMSYHNQSNLTPGQGSLIKLWNLGKPWETSGSAPPNAGPNMDPGFVVNSPMTISSPMNLTGDIIVNSHLTVSNTVLGFMQDKGIIINTGGAITVDNSHLIPYAGAGCFPQAQYWKGIEVKTPSKVRIMIKNNSVIDRAFTAIKGHNCNIEGYIITGSRINSYNYTSLDILNNAGYFQVIERCIINGKIAFENSIDGLRISGSSVTGPLFKVKSATLTILGSKIYSPLDIENMGSHTVRLYNSTFFNFVNANPLNGKGVVRDNTFKTSVNTFFNAMDLDLYNNNFEGTDGPSILGFRANTSTLLFKNNLSTSRYGINISNIFSGAKVECNSFLTKGLIDLYLREPIPFQGSEYVAAGNSFSRTSNLEVDYDEATEIRYFFHPQGKEEPLNINVGAQFFPLPLGLTIPSSCKTLYPDTPPIPEHCQNGIKDGDETGIDCGGSCPHCPDTPVIITPSNCINGIQDQGETGIDCGGPCPPCLSSCANGIQDNGEYGVDCGGPCPPCVISTPPTCTDGIMNGNETGVDCGGPTCPPCPVGDPVRPTCTDGVMNGNETGIDCGGLCPPCGTVVVYIPHCYNGVQDADENGIDCGGSCPPCVVVYPPHCYNGKKDGNESGIDCGGSCPPCGYYPPIVGSSGGNSETGGGAGKYTKGDHTVFVNQLNAIYGNGFMTGQRYQVSQDFAQHQAMLDGGNTCSVRDFIISQSASQPAKVIEILSALSPNVSPAVIHALFEKSQYFTSTQVAHILALNPALLTDAYVLSAVYKTNTFGPTDKSLILAAASANSSRVNAELMLSYKKQYQNAIIRDNIAMLSLNTPINFNDIRAELATEPSIYKIFDIAQTYADQGRHDLAAETLAGADLCQITDPIYRSQLSGLSYIYSNWQGIQEAKSSTRSEVGTMVNDLITHEHGIATDIAAQASGAEVKLKERWKYEPLVFATPSSTNEWSETNIDIYPNPAHDVLNINIKSLHNTTNMLAHIINADGKVVSEVNLQQEINNIDISALNSGVYTVKVMDNKQIVFVSKFIKIQ